jgi:hypothetical protein
MAKTSNVISFSLGIFNVGCCNSRGKNEANNFFNGNLGKELSNLTKMPV